jgi:hypothetical protein
MPEKEKVRKIFPPREGESCYPNKDKAKSIIDDMFYSSKGRQGKVPSVRHVE